MEDLISILTPKLFIYLVIIVMLFILVILEKTSVSEIFGFIKDIVVNHKNKSSSE
jgi:hypothetical protein